MRVKIVSAGACRLYCHARQQVSPLFDLVLASPLPLPPLQSGRVYSSLKSTSTRFKEANPDVLLRKALQRLSYDVDQGVCS
jgi:hypothetical protein